MNLQDLSIKGFLDKTAGKSPVPGGGSISALNGAIASALTEMLANLTIGKKKYENIESEMKDIVVKMSEIRKYFMHDIDRDSDAYNMVFEAYKMPDNTTEEKSERKEKIQERTKIASLIPMEVAERAFSMLDMISFTTIHGNQNAATDGCVAMMTCRTAILGALLNVRINLKSLEDTDFVNELLKKCEYMEKIATEKELDLINIIK